MSKLDRKRHERPFRLSRMDDLFDRWFADRFDWGLRGLLPAYEVDWAPAMDVIEKGSEFIVRAELPGVRKEDIEISVTGDSVTLKGKVERGEETSGECYYCNERSYGSFARIVRLPKEIDPEEVRAQLKDGVLELVLHKRAERKGKEVKVPIE
jgi:HSP20 family protein